MNLDFSPINCASANVRYIRHPWRRVNGSFLSYNYSSVFSNFLPLFFSLPIRFCFFAFLAVCCWVFRGKGYFFIVKRILNGKHIPCNKFFRMLTKFRRFLFSTKFTSSWIIFLEEEAVGIPVAYWLKCCTTAQSKQIRTPVALFRSLSD